MFTYTKEETIYAAEQFCFALQVWTNSFTEPVCGPNEEVIRVNGNQYHLDEGTQKQLAGSYFVSNIGIIYEFAKTGFWEGTNVFEERAYIEDELTDPLTELCAFMEVFDNCTLNFLDLSGGEVMDVKLNDEYVINILLEVLNAAFSRYQLLGGSVVTLDQLAILANVNIKTVRNAVSSKGYDRLVLSSTTISGKPTVDAEEATRWLLTKKGYTGPYIIGDIPLYETYQTLGQFQHHCLSLMKRANFKWDELQARWSWDTNMVQAFKQLLKLKVNENISLLTPLMVKQFGEECNAEKLERFVKEGSRIIASTLAEYKADSLFK